MLEPSGQCPASALNLQLLVLGVITQAPTAHEGAIQVQINQSKIETQNGSPRSHPTLLKLGFNTTPKTQKRRRKFILESKDTN
jgi:hypothetical protein